MGLDFDTAKKALEKNPSEGQVEISVENFQKVSVQLDFRHSMLRFFDI